MFNSHQCNRKSKFRQALLRRRHLKGKTKICPSFRELIAKFTIPITLMEAQFLISDQGDQIGRIFAQWAIVFFGHFFL
jgi:hypothetical protein